MDIFCEWQKTVTVFREALPFILIYLVQCSTLLCMNKKKKSYIANSVFKCDMLENVARVWSSMNESCKNEDNHKTQITNWNPFCFISIGNTKYLLYDKYFLQIIFLNRITCQFAFFHDTRYHGEQFRLFIVLLLLTNRETQRPILSLL